MKPVKLLPWLIGVSVAWSLGFVYNVYHGGIIGWHRQSYHNKVALAAKIQAEKRLILVGGSGTHYTPNSQYMEGQLGFPVINLGLDGKLGMDLIFPSVLKAIKKGDIVLLIPEYLLLLDDDGLGTISVHFSVATNQTNLADVSPRKFLEDSWMLGVPGLKTFVKSGVDLATKGYFDEYYSDPLTERGDPTRTWTRKSKWWQLKVSKPVSKYALDKIAKFKQDVEAKGATLVLSLPIIYGSTDEQTIKNVQKTAAELAKIAPLIYDRETLNIWTDSSLFADTHYHLLPEAKIIRSQAIITQLQPILKEINQ
jgi:hypothetical protein